MKKAVCLGIIVLIFCLAAPWARTAWPQGSLAYGAQEKKPEPTDPVYITMLFFKLAGKVPDFEFLARNTQEYRDAPQTYKPEVLDQQILDLKSNYSLITQQEPLVVETPVKLSKYSVVNKGFFVENFREDTFFPVKYHNQTYAIAPQGIMDKQWLKVTDPAVGKTIEDAAMKDEGKSLTMVLTLIPKYVDGSEPAVMDDEYYWLISVDVKSMALYAPDSPDRLWQSEDTSAEDARRRKLLNLRQ